MWNQNAIWSKSSKYTSENQKELDSLMQSHSGIKIRGKYKGNTFTLMWEKYKLLQKSMHFDVTNVTIKDIPTIMISHMVKITCAATQRIKYSSFFLINEIEMFVTIIFSSFFLSCHCLHLIIFFLSLCPPILNSYRE